MNAITIALYLGLFFIVGGFFLFIYSEMRLRELDREQWKNEQLIKSRSVMSYI
jgi:hypothetical protein